MRGRRIAFDYGEARIGVAVCDPDGILSSPLPFLDARKPNLLKDIAQLIDEYQPVTIFLGAPKHLSGQPSATLSKVEEFSTRLRTITTVAIVFVDERLSTVDAQRRLREAGKDSRASKLLIDSMAAVAILETGLQREN